MKTNTNQDYLELLVRLYVKSSHRASKRGYKASFYARTAKDYRAQLESLAWHSSDVKDQVERMIKIYQDRMEIDGKV